MADSAIPLAYRSETFGLTGESSWALPALELLCHVPRAYASLVAAWDRRHPGVRKALDRLVDGRFAAYQPGVIVDTRSGALADQPGPAVPRFRTTAKGRRLLEAAGEDPRELEQAFPRTRRNLRAVQALLDAAHLDDGNGPFGVSVASLVDHTGMADRSARWWVRHLVSRGYLRELPVKLADTREVIPPHWRPTKLLAAQIRDVLASDPQAPQHLVAELRLDRPSWLGDIDPARVGIGGATDYDHDVNAQQVLAALLDSPRCVDGGVFRVEPRIPLPVDTSARPWQFVRGGAATKTYQPDAELRERAPGGPVRRSIVEYERFQTRRDAWGHIEQFLGWLHTAAQPFEEGVLRFVVDSDARARSYVELIEAVADYALDHPERMPASAATLAVANRHRLADADDPLDDRVWYRIALPERDDTDGSPVWHHPRHSPYEEYFSYT